MRLFEGTQFDRPPRCERCEELEEDCVCEPEQPPRVAPGKQTARLTIEKRKKGKTVTVVRGLSPDDNDLSDLLAQLKTKCGAGGTIQPEGLEIQGRHLDRVTDVLSRIGYKVRSAQS
jgi:translation initiation factor 1